MPAAAHDMQTARALLLEIVVGKYVLAWILGVPAVVLVGIYAFTHLL